MKKTICMIAVAAISFGSVNAFAGYAGSTNTTGHYKDQEKGHEEKDEDEEDDERYYTMKKDTAMKM
jgi:hypothetical protein